jgi:hypothetical protein
MLKNAFECGLAQPKKPSKLQMPFELKNEIQFKKYILPGNVSEIMLKISMNWAPKRVPSLLRS